jgi:hypothetical protein
VPVFTKALRRIAQEFIMTKAFDFLSRNYVSLLSAAKLKGASLDPVRHRTLYKRLQNLGHMTQSTAQSVSNLKGRTKWKAVTPRHEQLLGLSEL